MKKSHYNFLFDSAEPEKSILYNTRTGAMAELDAEHTRQWKELDVKELERDNPEFAQALLAQGFAVEDEVSELDMIRFRSLQARYGNRLFSATVAPTLDCNFACAYCYEKDRRANAYMGEETRTALLRYLSSQILPQGKLSLTWYGGEPLLALDTVLETTEQLREICAKKQAEYSFCMITNGYLLNIKTLKKLLEQQIFHFQITLDGSRGTHNRRRPLTGGGTSYEMIWNNIQAMRGLDERLRIAIRVNVDKENTEALAELQDKIINNGLSDFVTAYPGKVVADGECYQKELCLENQEFARLEQEFFCGNPSLLPGIYPKPKYNYCGANSRSSAVIGPDGEIYKCWMELGDPKCSIGNVKEKNIRNRARFYQYMLQDITQEKGCSECRYLPVCMGGCPHTRLNGRKDCTSLRYTLDKYMVYLPPAMKQNAAERGNLHNNYKKSKRRETK